MNLFYDDKSFLLSAICSDNVYIESGHTRTFKKNVWTRNYAFDKTF